MLYNLNLDFMDLVCCMHNLYIKFVWGQNINIGLL